MRARFLVASMKFFMLMAIVVGADKEVRAQPGIPRQVSYQGVIYDSTGVPACDSIYTVDFTIYGAFFGGTPLWQERHVVQTRGGLFGVILGSTTPITFSTNQRLWLGMSINGRPELGPRTFLTSVPYAMRADSAATADVADDISAAAADRVRRSISVGSSATSDVTASGGIDSVTLRIRENVIGSEALEELHAGPIGPFGSSTTSAVVRIDAQGRVTAAEEVPISGVAPSGTAGGDLTGEYPDPSLRDAAVTVDKIADNAVTTSKLIDNAVTAIKIADNAITTPKTADNAITTSKIIDNAITSPKIIDNAITSTKILDNAITTSKIADNAITTRTIADNAITTPKIIDNAVTSPKIADNAVTGPKIADNAITTRTIANGSITADKIAGEALTGINIRTGSITSDRLSRMPLLPGSYGTSTRIPRINVDQSGRIVTIAEEPVRVAFDSAAGGALRGRYPNLTLADAAVQTVHIADGAVATASLSDAAVTTDKVADDGITSSKLASTGVVGGTYGSATEVPQFTVDAKGRITNVSNVAIAGVAPSGAAGGDLAESYPDPTVIALQGQPVSAATPSTDQVLAWDGSAWTPTTLPAATVMLGGIAPQDVMTPNDGDAVCYDAATNRWVACNPTANTRKFVLAEGDNIDVDGLRGGGTELNDVALSDHTYFRLTNASATADLTGLAAGENGRIVIVLNTASQPITLHEQDGRSIEQARLILGSASLTLEVDRSVTLMYSAPLQRWVLVSKS